MLFGFFHRLLAGRLHAVRVLHATATMKRKPLSTAEYLLAIFALVSEKTSLGHRKIATIAAVWHLRGRIVCSGHPDRIMKMLQMGSDIGLDRETFVAFGASEGTRRRVQA